MRSRLKSLKVLHVRDEVRGRSLREVSSRFACGLGWREAEVPPCSGLLTSGLFSLVAVPQTYHAIEHVWKTKVVQDTWNSNIAHEHTIAKTAVQLNALASTTVQYPPTTATPLHKAVFSTDQQAFSMASYVLSTDALRTLGSERKSCRAPGRPGIHAVSRM